MDSPTSAPLSANIDRRFLLGGLTGAAGLAALAAVAKAGPLTPPGGAVASTGKTLTEVEPRTAISATNTPGDADSVYRITQPGAYYLTASVLAPAGKACIEVAASGVTIDLNGFQLSTTGGLTGVVATGALGSITIRNGRITACTTGVSMSAIPRVVLENLIVESCTATGAFLGVNARVTDCTFNNNLSSGLTCDARAVVARCSFVDNGSLGLRVNVQDHFGNYGGAVITECVAEGNGSVGIAARGVISRCYSFGNGSDGFSADTGSTVSDCAAAQNEDSGFQVRESTVTGCTAVANGLSGFSIYFWCNVSNCLAQENGIGSTSTFAAGFYLSGRLNRVTDCVSSDNIFGFRNAAFTADTNFLARNTAMANTTNWSLTSGNICYVVAADTTTAINGNTGGASPGSTNPNANYTVLS